MGCARNYSAFGTLALALLLQGVAGCGSGLHPRDDADAPAVHTSETPGVRITPEDREAWIMSTQSAYGILSKL